MLKNLKEKIKYLKGLPVDTFRDIYIETVATCTNNCFMCPRRDVKHYGFMSDEMFKNIIKKLKEINYCGNIHLYGQGEPFLDKKIIDKIYYIKSELPNSNIILISNFTVLNDEFIDKILKAPIKNFSCSAYALTDETYGKITGRKNNFKNSFINQVKFLKKYGEKIPFSFAYYIMNTKTFDNDFEFMIDYFFNTVPAAFLQLDLVSTLFNSKHEKLLPTRNYFSDCIYTILKISYDGLISICPCDVENKMAVGKINEENNLKEIYFSSKAQKIRRKMFFSHSENAYCQSCQFRRCAKFFEYFLGFSSLSKTDPYAHKIDTLRNSDAQIKEKLKKFNNLFKDGEEDKWLSVLEQQRQDFYKKKEVYNDKTI